MTFAATCVGLFPILWATGAGSDVMKRVAAPMVGGIFTSFVLELLVYPAIYESWRWGISLKSVRLSQSAGRVDAQPDGGAAAGWSWPAAVPAEEPQRGQ
jgi:hypothetical protein